MSADARAAAEKKRRRHDHRGPDAVEHRRRTCWRNGEWMPAKNTLLVFGRRFDAGDLVDGFEHAFGGRDAAHRLATPELVPDLAVVRRGLLEEPDRRRRHVVHLHPRHHATELRERAMLEIGPPWLFPPEVRLDLEGRADFLQSFFVGFRKRVAAALGRVPA